MKTAFSNTSECFHVFSQQAQDYGRAASASFNRNKAYSYSQCIGNIQGNNIFLIDWNYSNTTAKHNSHLRSAVSHYNQIFINYPEYIDDERNIISFERKSENIINKLATAKKPEIYFNEYEILKNTIQKYLDAVKLDKSYKKRLEKIINNDLENSDLITKAKERIKANLLKAKQQIEQSIVKFRNFETDYIHNSEFSYLRLNGENIETSKGVTIEKSKVSPFVSIYKRFLETKDANLLPHLIGKHLDYYTINSANDKLVKIGCHTITKDEILMIA